MLEYKTIRGSDPSIFDDDVNRHLDLGFILQGGISIAAVSDVRTGITCLMSQAMTRIIDDPAVALDTFNSK
jgi:hypothetical protein